MHILIAPNAFKNSLPATAAAKAIEKGLGQSKLRCTCECFPVGDGGDGTATLLVQRFNGSVISVPVYDPLGRKINAAVGFIDNRKTAVIELADASGLRLLKPEELSPLMATTFGTGELLKAALDSGVNKIVLCIGGSATVDGGTGILQSLGICFFDDRGQPLSTLPQDLIHLHHIDCTALDKRIVECELTIVCDVDNTMLGKYGAAPVFGPQKGATEKEVQQLETALKKFRNVVLQQTGRDMAAVKHGGSAGGTAAGLHTFLKARLVTGIDYFLEATGFKEALQRAGLVITGEGSLDRQTLNGKAPLGVAVAANEKGIPVIGLAGAIPLRNDKELNRYFTILLSIAHAPMNLENAMPCTEENLVRTAKELGNLLAIGAAL